jgi:tetratricopeptide (TPR) repeat protein
VHLQLAWSLRQAGRFEEATTRGRKALEAASSGRHHQGDLARGAREVIVFTLAESGRPEDAERFVAELEEGQEELRDWIRQKSSIDRYNQGIELLGQGRLPEAIDAFEAVRQGEGVQQDRRDTAARTLQGVLLQHGQELLQAGELEPAEAALERAGAIAIERQDGLGQSTILAVRAEVREHVGDGAGAADLASQAAALAATGGDRALAGDCWMVAGQALFEADPDKARAAFSDALAAWGDDPETLGRRAAVTYNLAVLDLRLEDDGDSRVRFGEARELARRAGDPGLVARIDEILTELESD